MRKQWKKIGKNESLYSFTGYGMGKQEFSSINSCLYQIKNDSSTEKLRKNPGI